MIPLTAKQDEGVIFSARGTAPITILWRIIMNQLRVIAILTVMVCVLPLLSVGQEPSSGVSVAESKLGKNVVEREVVDETSSFSVNDRVYLWMKLTGGPADSVTVTWSVDEYSWSTNLNVGASSWRTWAYKTAWKAGTWNVSVTDANGKVLLDKDFTVTP